MSAIRAFLISGCLVAALATVNSNTALAAQRGYAHTFSDWSDRLAAPGAKRSGEANAADYESVPRVVIGDGVRAVAEGVVATGYDSNIDHFVTNTDGSAYGLVDLGLALIAGPKTSETTAVVRGGYGYHDIDNRPDRWDVGVLIDHYQQISSEVSWDFGGFFLHDDVDTDANERAAGYSQLSYNTATAEAFVRSRVMNSRYLASLNSGQANQLFFPRDETFDHLRYEESIGVLILKDQSIAPFFELGYANLDYTREIDPTAFSRDGDEIWAIGGVRVTLSPTLHVDLGARYNQRWLDDPVIRSHDSVFFDGKVVWTPSDDLYVEFNVDRSFLEPIVETALLTESTSYSLLTNTKLDDLTWLKFEIGHITEDEIGAPDTFQHIYAEARLTHEIAKNTEVFASVLGYHTRNEASDLEADRVNAMVGIKVHN